MKSSNVAHVPTRYGTFNVRAYMEDSCEQHLALYLGDLGGDSVPVRIHSECLTGDTLHSLKCDCGEQLEAALKHIQEKGVGLLIYLRQEGRGIGLFNKINAYALQDEGRDTIEANNELGFPTDMRDYHIAAKIIKELGIKSVALLTNNREKIKGLQESGINVVERIPLKILSNPHNERYLRTKKERMHHML